MIVYLLRHAQTAGNLERRYIGRIDEPLCEAGWTAVRQAGPHPDVDCVVVSPLCRARETAAGLFPKARQIVCADLREMDFGAFEGRSAAEMAEDDEYRTWVDGGCLASCPNGESLEYFTIRACAAFDQAVRQALADGKNRLIVVAHGGSIMVIMSRYARPAQRAFSWQVPPCQGYRAVLDGAAWESDPVLTDWQKMDSLDLHNRSV